MYWPLVLITNNRSEQTRLSNCTEKNFVFELVQKRNRYHHVSRYCRETWINVTFDAVVRWTKVHFRCMSTIKTILVSWQVFSKLLDFTKIIFIVHINHLYHFNTWKSWNVKLCNSAFTALPPPLLFISKKLWSNVLVIFFDEFSN